MTTPVEQPTPDDAFDPQEVGAGIDYTDPNSALAWLYLRTSHILFAGMLVFVFLFYGVFTPLGHTDIWGHLKYGEWIVNQRALPEKELFSAFSDQEQPYWNFQWLSQTLFYLAYHAGELLVQGDELRQAAGGVEMLRSLHGLLMALKFAFLTLAVWRSTRSLPIALSASTLLLAMTLAPGRIQRPQVFAEVFFAILIWWASGPQLSRITWLVVPLLFVVWANCHGSFVIGYLFLGLVCSGRVIESWWSQSQVFRSSWLWQGLAALALTPIAMGLLNPHGFEMYANVLQLSRHPNLRTITEWAPLDFGELLGGSAIYLIVLGLVVLSQAVSPRPIPLSRLLVLLAFAVGSLYQQRILVWLLMVTPWVVAPLWKHALALVPRSRFPARSVASLRKTMIAGALILIGFSWSGFCQLITGRDPLPLGASVTHATLWQVSLELKQGGAMPPLADALKAYPNKRFEGRIFVQDCLADYLMWSLPERERLLVYNHAHVFPEEIWQHQLTILSANPGWASLVDRYQVNLIIFDPLAWPDLATQLRADRSWAILLDEGVAGSEPQLVAVHNMKLFVALRKQPI